MTERTLQQIKDDYVFAIKAGDEAECKWADLQLYVACSTDDEYNAAVDEVNKRVAGEMV